jgi:GNAT superfamily N-acetyltransferase
VLEPRDRPPGPCHGLAQGLLAPIGKISWSANLLFGPGAPVSLLEGAAENPVTANRCAAASQNLAQLLSREVQKNGIGEDAIVGAAEIVVANIEEQRLMPGLPQPFDELRGGVASGHEHAPGFKIVGVPARATAELEDMLPLDQLGKMVQVRKDRRCRTRTFLQVALGCCGVGGQRRITRVAETGRAIFNARIIYHIRLSTTWVFIMNDVIIRPVQASDLRCLLALYTELAEGRDESIPAADEDGLRILDAIVADPARHLLVAVSDGEVVGSVDMIVIPNLTHHGRPWAIMENVIVAERRRRSGVGTALLRSALGEAAKAGCYKMQLHSGKQRSGAHAFYRARGMEAIAEGFKIYFSTSE